MRGPEKGLSRGKVDGRGWGPLGGSLKDYQGKRSWGGTVWKGHKKRVA